MGFGAGGLRIPIPIRVHAELLWLLPAFFLFLSHPFLYATFANLPVFLLFLFFFPLLSPPLPASPSPFPVFSVWFLLSVCVGEGSAPITSYLERESRSQSAPRLLLGQVISELQ